MKFSDNKFLKRGEIPAGDKENLKRHLGGMGSVQGRKTEVGKQRRKFKGISCYSESVVLIQA